MVTITTNWIVKSNGNELHPCNTWDDVVNHVRNIKSGGLVEYAVYYKRKDGAWANTTNEDDTLPNAE